jgi:hypothetical protein
MVAVWAPVFGFRFSKLFADLKKGIAYFATDLLAAFAVVVIQIL